MIVLEHLLKYLTKRERQLTDPEGDTALHIACFSEINYQKYQIVETLLNNGFDPFCKSYHGYTAFDVIDNPHSDARYQILLDFSQKKKSKRTNLLWESPEKSKTVEKTPKVGHI